VRVVQPVDVRPSCANPETGGAHSGYRYHELADAYGSRGVIGSICDPTWNDPVDQVRAVLIALVGGGG